MIFRLNSSDSEQTEKIGEKLGSLLKGSEVIDIKSDLGGGKTTLVRGIAKGAGSEDKVASPSFTISRVYETPKLKIYHYDFYRLNEAGLSTHEVKDILNDPSAVLVVEWGDIIRQVLPDDRLSIEIKTHIDDSRELIFNYPADLAYLVEKL